MPVDVIDIRKDIPTARRNRSSAIKQCPEWNYVQTKLAAGLKPNEGLRIVLTNQTLKKAKNAPRLFKKMIERHIKDLKLDYDVFQRGNTPEGTPIIYIAGRSPEVA